MSYSLVADPQHKGGWVLLVDGVSQSYVDTKDETALRFSYMRRVATVIDSLAPSGAPIRALACWTHRRLSRWTDRRRGHGHVPIHGRKP